MLTGLLHLHRTLAYLVFLTALVSVILVLSRGRTDPKMAAMVGAAVRYGIHMGGGLTVLIGLGLWAAHPSWSATTPWIWVSLLLWGPVEVLGRRLVLPEVSLVQDGGQGTSRMILGAVGQLLAIAAIFGLMSARP